MRMLRWNAEMIRYMRQAAEYGDYDRSLADIILPSLHPGDFVVEAGCGLGYLALELAGHVRRYTALDRNPDVLEVLRENRDAAGADNLEIVCAELEGFCPDEPPDAMLFCLFGTESEMLSAAERVNCRKVIAVFRRERDALWKDDVKKCAVKNPPDGWKSCAALALDLPLDQPFRDREDARAFAAMYRAGDDGHGLTEAELDARLRPVGHPVYNFALPIVRKLEIRVLEREDGI